LLGDTKMPSLRQNECNSLHVQFPSHLLRQNVHLVAKLKLIKTHLCTTMTDERLSSIATIFVHKERAKQHDLDCVVDPFVEMYPNCRIALK